MRRYPILFVSVILLITILAGSCIDDIDQQTTQVIETSTELVSQQPNIQETFVSQKI